MSHYVAAYDISDSRHRERVARILSRYGQRVQLSVFQIWIEPDDLPQLRREVGAYLALDDAFDLFPLDCRDPERRIRWQHAPPGREAVRLL
jgi:CRISPR-associated endonuclease Cas2